MLGLLSVINFSANRSKVLHIHRFMLAYPLVQLIYTTLSIMYWRSRTKDVETPLWIKPALVAAYAVFKAYLFGLLMVIAKGWSITRKRIAFDECFAVAVATLVLVASMVAYYVLEGLFLIALFITYAIALAFMFSGIGRNVRALKAQMLIILQDAIDPRTTPPYHKARAFMRLQTLLTLYVACHLMINMIAFFATTYPALQIMASEILDTVLAAWVGYIFRISCAGQVAPIFDTPLGPGPEAFAETNLDAQMHGVLARAIEATRSRGLRAWQSNSDTLPSLPSFMYGGGGGSTSQDVIQPQRPIFIVVENPPSLSSENKPMANISLGLFLSETPEPSPHSKHAERPLLASSEPQPASQVRSRRTSAEPPLLPSNTPLQLILPGTPSTSY